MRRLLAHAIGLVALILPAAGLVPLFATAVARAATGEVTGQITGRVTDARGSPLVAITVAAAPVRSPDTLTTTATDTAGRYVLDLPPGQYVVAFNALDPVNDSYDSVTFGGLGPAPGAACTVCGGRPVTVTAGQVSSAVGAALASAPFPQKGYLRPLSGNAIRVIAGRLSFRIGCHIEPTGCLGTARLRLGHGATGPTIASVRVVVLPGMVGRLVFKLPASVEARLRRARHRALPALVEISAPPSHTITRFELVER